LRSSVSRLRIRADQTQYRIAQVFHALVVAVGFRMLVAVGGVGHRTLKQHLPPEAVADRLLNLTVVFLHHGVQHKDSKSAKQVNAAAVHEPAARGFRVFVFIICIFSA
jgi:hypothetical protein